MRTTRCCSAIALTAALAACASARPQAQAVRALPFFPTRAVWTLALNNGLAQPPVYDARRGYFPIAGDRLVAYDMKTGEQLWTVSASPVMPLACGDDLIFVPAKDGMIALHADDGSAAWRLPLDDTIAVPPVWDNGWLILATDGGTIVAISAKDGRTIWRRDLGVVPHARPALAADRVYIPLANTYVVALNVATGEEIWSRRLGGDPNDILALDDRIYLGSTDNYAYCLNAATGTVEWRYVTGADVIGVPAYDDDRVYIVSFDNTIRALSRRSGVQLWFKQLPLRPTSGAVRAGATILAAGQATTLPMYNARDGAPVGSLTAPHELAAPAQIVAPSASGQPAIVLVGTDVAKGASVSLISRGVDPAPAPLGALPGAITTLPAAPAMASGQPAPRPQD